MIKKISKKILHLTGMLLFTPCVLALAPPKNPPLPKNIQTFIQMMVKKHHFNQAALTHLFQKTKMNPVVIQRINHPYEKKPWNVYRSFFITEKRVKHGADYWHKHQKELDNIKKLYGVDPSIIVAIIGVESLYGKIVGQYPELSTLTTLAFQYPKRSRFFKKELVEYLLLTRQLHIPPQKLTGSYAGALGIPQFMPSNYRRYAIDYYGKEEIDLINDHEDAMASVANYLKISGWKLNQPVAVSATVKKYIPKNMLSKRARLNTTLKALAKLGITPKFPFKKSEKVALIAMKNQHFKEYWIIFPNFRAIMSYNPRTTYALAVYQLSQEIRKYYEQTFARKSESTTKPRKI